MDTAKLSFDAPADNAYRIVSTGWHTSACNADSTSFDINVEFQ